MLYLIFTSQYKLLVYFSNLTGNKKNDSQPVKSHFISNRFLFY